MELKITSTLWWDVPNIHQWEQQIRTNLQLLQIVLLDVLWEIVDLNKPNTRQHTLQQYQGNTESVMLRDQSPVWNWSWCLRQRWWHSLSPWTGRQTLPECPSAPQPPAAERQDTRHGVNVPHNVCLDFRFYLWWDGAGRFSLNMWEINNDTFSCLFNKSLSTDGP